MAMPNASAAALTSRAISMSPREGLESHLGDCAPCFSKLQRLDFTEKMIGPMNSGAGHWGMFVVHDRDHHARSSVCSFRRFEARHVTLFLSSQASSSLTG
jgi:hypothetical protein